MYDGLHVLQAATRVQAHLSYTREENIKYTAVWGLLRPWRTESKANFQSDAKKLVPEGVEGRVAYKGMVEDTVFQLLGGLRSGMGYCGAADIRTLQETEALSRFPLPP